MTTTRLVLQSAGAGSRGRTLAERRKLLRAHLICGTRSVSVAPMEADLLLTLAGNSNRTRSEIAEVLWPNPDKMPDTWGDNIRVRISVLRGKLRSIGSELSIRCAWGQHYSLDAHGIT